MRWNRIVARLHGLRFRLLHHFDTAAVGPDADLGFRLVAAKHGVHDVGDRRVQRKPIAVLDLYDDVECRRRLAFEDRLARAAPLGFLVGERHGADAADQIGERGIHEYALEVQSVRRADELHAALCDRAGRDGFSLGADLVDDDRLRHVVLDRFDHDRVLIERHVDLHAPGVTDAGVRDISVAGDLVRRVHDDDALAQVARKHTRYFAQHRRLADAGLAQQQYGLAGAHDVEDDIDRAVDRAADAARQADDLAVAVAQARDAMQRLLDPGAVVLTEFTDAGHDGSDVIRADRDLRQVTEVGWEASFREPPEVEDDLDEVFEIR